MKTRFVNHRLSFRILGLGWILLGLVTALVPAVCLWELVPWDYVLHHGLANTLDLGAEMASDFSGLALCLGVMVVGGGLFCGKLWAQISCGVLAVLALLLASRDYHSHRVGPVESLFLFCAIALALVSLAFLLAGWCAKRLG